MASNDIYKKKLNEDGTPYIDPETKDFVMILVSSEQTEEPIVLPNWRGVTLALQTNVMIAPLIPSANPNGFSMLLKYLSDGEAGYSNGNNIADYIKGCAIAFTDEQKQTINQILTDNNFNSQL